MIGFINLILKDGLLKFADENNSTIIGFLGGNKGIFEENFI